jgi:hypothetical protein
MFASTLVSKGGAVCGSSARTDLCGGRPAMGVPTASPCVSCGTKYTGNPERTALSAKVSGSDASTLNLRHCSDIASTESTTYLVFRVAQKTAKICSFDKTKSRTRRNCGSTTGHGVSASHLRSPCRGCPRLCFLRCCTHVPVAKAVGSIEPLSSKALPHPPGKIIIIPQSAGKNAMLTLKRKLEMDSPRPVPR